MPHLVALLLAVLFISCNTHDLDTIDRGNVTFYNASSYSVTITRSSFSGTILVEKLASGKTFTTTISPSNNYGIGDIFSFEYFFMVANEAEVLGGNVWATSGQQIENQEQQNIEAGKNYTIRIPNPKKLNWSEAFVKIINKSSKSIEFNYMGVFYRLDNLETSVASGKIGVYKVYRVSLSEPSVEIKGYTITQLVEQYPIPTFTAEAGHTYTLEFDGKEVRLIGEYKI